MASDPDNSRRIFLILESIIRAMRFPLIFAGFLSAVLAVGIHAQKAADGDWPMYGRDLAGTKFSPLKQVNADNVARLQPAWTLTLVDRPQGQGRGRGVAGPPQPSNPEVTPIVVNGVMYLLSAGNTIAAVDAATGQRIWQHSIDGESTGRGVAFWPGDRNNPERILFTASAPKDSKSARLMALDAATGKPSEGFGTNGVVDIGVAWNGVPMIVKNLIVLGATVGEVPDGPPGDTRAYDARDGKKLWEFHTVPRPGEFGHESWLDNGWDHRSGTNVWAFSMTADEARGLVYMPVAGPAANYWGGDRPGNNLFANSIAAVDIATGQYRWHFQTVHHDIWDIDMSAAPGLVDIKQGTHTIPALATVGKGGYMFILDRTNGKPVYGVEERPVPKGNVPGEWYSPTQPFPLKPPALAKTSFRKKDMVTEADTTAEHAAACPALWARSGGFAN